jgi:FixJ family two-component response regulator
MLELAIVDEDLAVRTGLGRLFSLSGYQVSLFASAEEFLAHLPNGRPVCLVLDRQMGSMSGDDLLKELIARGIALPTIMISSLFDDENGQQTGKWPPSRRSLTYLRKPFSAGAILGAVQAVMDAERSALP